MIKFFKSWGYVLMAFVFSIMSVFPSFASLATASDATMSDATYADDVYDLDEAYFLADDDISLYASGSASSFTGTVDKTKIRAYFEYYDMNGVLHRSSGVSLTKDGYFSFSRPADYVKMRYMVFHLTPVLPPSGAKYSAQIGFTSNAGGFTYKRLHVYTQKVIQNAAYQSKDFYPSFTQSSGDYSTSFKFDLGSVSLMQFLLYSDDIQFPYGGYFNLRFVKLDSGASVDTTTAGGAQSSADVAKDTANNTSQIAQNTATMNDTLKEIVQTISKQLEALWNQMYNYIHLEDMANADKNADKIVDALQNGLTVEVENDDRNTETIVNGYDKSTIDKSNSDLSDSLSGYESAESAASDDAMGYIKDFKYPDLESEFGKTHAADCIGIIADIMQKTFVAMGALNLPITVGFTLIFVTMLLGYHRFRN